MLGSDRTKRAGDPEGRGARQGGLGLLMGLGWVVLAWAGSACIQVPPAADLETDDPRLEATLDPRSLFMTNCATCHLGGGGLLGSPRTPDLFEEALPRGESEAALLYSIRFGVDPPRMPAFQGGLSESEMLAIVEYIVQVRAAIRID